MPRRSSSMRIISTWSSSSQKKTVDIGRCRGIYGLWFKAKAMLLPQSGQRNAGSKQVCSTDVCQFEMIMRIILSTASNNSAESFSIVFSLFEVSETHHFVARQEELAAIHRTLSGGTGRRAVVLHGLGGIGKTQLAVAYVKTHQTDYSAI